MSNTQVCRDPREREVSSGLQDLQDLKDLQDSRVNLECEDFLVTAVEYFGNVFIDSLSYDFLNESINATLSSDVYPVFFVGPKGETGESVVVSVFFFFST